ncbi:LamG domain-containing protein [Streptomyces sp. FIT100]|uniref:LamG domain-containing protein n=1 Tax=Streptomyces sp. FIT100 TaxID=2837956 RepID=UPI0028BE93CC|nr:LamG domain-containing protein [Streptomyces sp. FIT100]
MAALAASVLTAGLLTSPAYAAVKAAPADAGALATQVERSASVLAAESGEPVEVVSERTPYSLTMANPDGTFTLTQSTTPQRAKGEDGSWQPIDTTLERRANGTIGPKSAVVDLSFSGGGSGSRLIRIASAQGAVELGWPEALPEPALSGPTATYSEVFEGVDLQLTATAEGYREVLLVKSAQAAANPELNEIKLSVMGDGLTLRPGAGGGLRALDGDGNAVFTGPAGQMWDSAGDEEGTQSQLMRTAVAESEPAGGDPSQPGKGDASAELPVEVSGDAVTIKPDTELLRGAETVYPVYIDPPLGLGASERSVISSDGDRFWQFSGDYGVGRCYRVGPWYCDADHTNRMLFEFAPSALVGKHIVGATFRAFETWSFSCTAHWVDLWRTNNMSEATRWPGPSKLDLMGDVNISAGRGDNCAPSQPDAWVDFVDNASETDENLTATVRNFAAGKFSRLTLMLAAKDEGDADAWKRFDDNAELQVSYVPRPGVPSHVGTLPGDGVTYYCKSSQVDPLIVTRQDPMVQSVVQTEVQPKSGEFTGSLRTYITVDRVENGKWVASWAATLPSVGYHPDGTAERMRMNPRADNTLYRMRALTNSFWTTGGVTSSIPSAWSPYCYFKIDATAPKEPQIRTTGIYSECTATVCEGAGGPGLAGEFALSPNAGDTDITGYRWRLIGDVSTHVESGAAVTIRPIPPMSGTQTLTAEAKDVLNRWGPPAEFAFKVASAHGPVGRWHFADGTPGSSVTTAEDSATGGIRHPATLHPVAGNKAATWSSMARRGTDDYSLALNDDVIDAAQQIGYADTASPPLNTMESFTVSAWALLTDTTKNRVVISAPGTYGSAFQLSYSASAKKWVFGRVAADVTSPVYVNASAAVANPPVGVWTHLAGVFDSKGDDDDKNDTIQLFVNGRPQGDPVVLHAVNANYSPTASAGGMMFGRSRAGEYFSGRVDEVIVWQRALTSDEVRQDSALTEDGVPATELVGHWDATAATTATLSELTPYTADNMTGSAGGTAPDPESDALVFDGESGAMTTQGPVVDEAGSFTVTAAVQLDSAKLAAKPVGYRAQVFGQKTATGSESSWAIWVEKVSEGGYMWRFGRTATDTNGTVTDSSSVPSSEPAETDTWVQVTGVFNAAEATDDGYGSTHLYVTETEQDQLDGFSFDSATQGSGELAVGRGSANGTTGHYLPGAIDEVRIWTGAMTAEQVASKVLGSPGEE